MFRLSYVMNHIMNLPFFVVSVFLPSFSANPHQHSASSLLSHILLFTLSLTDFQPALLPTLPLTVTLVLETYGARCLDNATLISKIQLHQKYSAVSKKCLWQTYQRKGTSKDKHISLLRLNFEASKITDTTIKRAGAGAGAGGSLGTSVSDILFLLFLSDQ